MGSQPGLLGSAEPPNFSLSALSVVMTAPGSTEAAAPQSQGRPLLGQICRAARTSDKSKSRMAITRLYNGTALQHMYACMLLPREDCLGTM